MKKQLLMSLEAAPDLSKARERTLYGGALALGFAHNRVNGFGAKADADGSGTKKNLGYERRQTEARIDSRAATPSPWNSDAETTFSTTICNSRDRGEGMNGRYLAILRHR